MKPDFDVLVVGGGIHGAGVAQAAAAQGYRVLVIERTGLASGTSSRSSKLIHGGLRYLESGQFALVRECLHERAILQHIAPHLVQLVPFHIPIYSHTRRRPVTVRTGLALYGVLTGMKPGARFRSVPASRWADLDGLNTDGLSHVFQYWDGQTDDARLTRSVMASAQELGAKLLMPASLMSAQWRDDAWTVELEKAEAPSSITASVIVNAAGPWATTVARLIDGAPIPVPVELVQGTHIIVPGLLSHGIYYVEAPADGRAVFVMPWNGNTLVGTTETRFRGDPCAVAPTDDEVDYLLATLSHYFPRYRGRGKCQLVSAFAGLRVLPAGEGSAFARPRETVLQVDNETTPRVLSLFGGKLTAYRATAQKVVEKIARSLPAFDPKADTATLRLPEIP